MNTATEASDTHFTAEDRLSALLAVLNQGQYDYADEQRCQSDIEQHLVKLGVNFEREFQLSQGIIDFYFPRSGLGLEIKASKQWSRRAVYRQCERYCEDDRITGLLLATGRSQGLPETINDKPVRVMALGVTHL